ncbi:SHUGOSHIN 2 [Linum grandiflorum]
MVSERPAKRSPIGRRTLSDITNNQSQPPPTKLAVLKENSSQIHGTHGDLLNRFLQNLSMRYQTLLLQNRSLAQSHSQMLTELNSAKDRLRNLHHDLMCKEALLKSRNVESQGNRDIDSRKAVAEVKEANDKKPCKRGRKKSTRSQSMGSTTVQAEVEKQKAETTRRSSRRQSAGFVERKQEDTNLIEIDKATFAGPQSSVVDEDTSDKEPETKRRSSRRQSAGFVERKPEDTNLFAGSKSSMVDEDTSEQRNEPLGEAASSKSSKVEHHSDKEPEAKRRCLRRKSAAGLVESHESEPEEINVDKPALGEPVSAEARRISMGRPVRRAAEKVCYKEPSLIQKMRRDF